MVSFGGNVIEILIKATDGASANIEAVKGKLAGLGSAVKKLRGPLIALGAASVAGAALSIKAFAELEQNFANINTLLDEGVDANELYGDSIRRLAKELPIVGGELALTEGLYQTISAGITDTAEATLFLEEATKASIGGQAELSTVILAGTKAMAAFGIEAEDSSRVFDVFAATVQAGQTTLPELAAAFPVVAGSAAEMGVSLEETAGILAGLTKVLPSTDEAATSLGAVLTGLLKPSDAMKDTLAELGFESGKAAIEQEGLIGLLNILKDEVDGDAEAMGELFGNVRALRAVFPALGAAADDIAESMEIVGNSTGLASKQFKDQEGTINSRMTKIQNNFQVLAASIGEKLVPILEKLFPILEAGVELFGKLDPVIQVGILALGALAGVVALLAPAIGAVSGLIGGAGGLGAILTLLTGPIGLIILAVGLLAAAWATNFGGIQEKVQAVIEVIAPLFDRVLGILQRLGVLLIEILTPAFTLFIETVEPIIQSLWDNVFEPTLGLIITGLTGIIDTFDAIVSALEGDMKPLEKVLDNIALGFTEFFTGIVDAAFDFGANLVTAIVDGIKSIGSLIAETFANLIPPEIRQFIDGGIDVLSSGISAAASGLGLIEPVEDLIISGNRVFKPAKDDTIAAFKGESPLGIGGGTPNIETVNVQLINPVFSNDLSFEENGAKIGQETVRQYRRLKR